MSGQDGGDALCGFSVCRPYLIRQKLRAPVSELGPIRTIKQYLLETRQDILPLVDAD
jgi:hypothetical protein